jgi:hypothetical protein
LFKYKFICSVFQSLSNGIRIVVLLLFSISKYKPIEIPTQQPINIKYLFFLKNGMIKKIENNTLLNEN